MRLILEESEDISTELLTSLLDTVKKDNQDVLPSACKQGMELDEVIMGIVVNGKETNVIDLRVMNKQSTGNLISQ